MRFKQKQMIESLQSCLNSRHVPNYRYNNNNNNIDNNSSNNIFAQTFLVVWVFIALSVAKTMNIESIESE